MGGLVRGRWSFADAGQSPSTSVIARELSAVTGLSAVCVGSGPDERIDVSAIGQSLFDIDRIGSRLTVWGYVPPHPYLWENLDVALATLGGRIEVEETFWRPDPRHGHLRRAWKDLRPRQRLLLRFPAVGASRPFDRFV